METSSICRICLSGNSHHLIQDTGLQEVYEKLTSIPFQNTVKPLLVCYICHAMLYKTHRFMLQCLKAEQLLSQITNQLLPNEDEVEQKLIKMDRTSLTTFLCTFFIENINIEGTHENIKEEISCEEDVKCIKAEDKNEQDTPTPADDVNPDSEADNEQIPWKSERRDDSDDDIPLNCIKEKIERVADKKNVTKATKIDRIGCKNTFKMDANEVLLSKDQQMENLVARSKSINYLNSPYKCDKCYKGFVNCRAYANHNMKHDECSGAFACDVCRMRYTSRQQLRTHAVRAHARVFKCNRCDHQSQTANQARVHDRWHSGYTYECQLCSHKFMKPTSYLSHMRKSHPSEHICDICGENFIGKHGLQMHKMKTHRNDSKTENPVEPAEDRFCSECNIQFVSVDAWKLHILCSDKHALNNGNSTHCAICGLQVPGSALSAHMRDHEKRLRQSKPQPVASRDLMRLQCQQCGANFLNRSKLQAHVRRIHLGMKYNKNIVCEVCGKKCTSNATLKYHQRTHTGERPYACTTCSKQFADSNQLRIHTRTHTGERPYVCNDCGKNFSQKPALNRHYRVHTGVKPYACQYCLRTFSQSNSLKLHVRTVHLKLPANNRKNKRNVAPNTTEDIQVVDI